MLLVLPRHQRCSAQLMPLDFMNLRLLHGMYISAVSSAQWQPRRPLQQVSDDSAPILFDVAQYTGAGPTSLSRQAQAAPRSSHRPGSPELWGFCSAMWLVPGCGRPPPYRSLRSPSSHSHWDPR
ncbi:hypothetical protein NDU88_002605 [Pleurodeles waltl]|uniref:Uncharacterized protein n=1 Tax=Pleurodeles waltl TaxID=8319 RepID=A0AAV7T2Q6_PLEWA|nr:hypothetical protein NDU88_002605 [Pleurodeles waltl]